MKRYQNGKLHIGPYIPALILILSLVVFLFAATKIGNSQSTNERELLDKALSRSITQCYALEGAYPSSLSYLEEHYGLTYDSDDFLIDYHYIGSNLRPTYMIIERSH